MTPVLVLADPVARTSTGEAVQFWILAIVAVLGALGMVFSRKAVHSALMLAVAMVCLAILYIAQGAVFLGIVQIVVYTGAVMMLFLFVLMLIGVDSSDSLVETIRGQRIAAVVVGLGFGILLIAGLANASLGTFTGTDAANAQYGSNILGLAHLLFTQYVWAFEVTGALLITAAVGAMVLAHRERPTPRKTQRELAEERVRTGRRVTPLPAPGVYARHNAVDVPALLPDGSPSQLSVNRTLSARPRFRLHAPVEEIGGGGEGMTRTTLVAGAANGSRPAEGANAAEGVNGRAEQTQARGEPQAAAPTSETPEPQGPTHEAPSADEETTEAPNTQESER